MRPAILLTALLLLAPLLLVDVPPLLDYPNHLARLYLLAHGANEPGLAPLFTPHWAIIPNLAIDLVGPPLLRLLPVHVAGRLILAALLLLPFAGVIALNRALFGRVQPWALASALVIPSGAFLLGFLNFIAGTGAALLLAAFWIAHRPRHPRATLLLAGLASIALFFCHLMGSVFALILILTHEARSPRTYLATTPLILIPALLYLSAPLNTLPAAAEYLPLAQKLAQLLTPFTAYNLPLDILTAAAVALFLLACALTRRLDTPPGIRLALLACAALYAAAPYAFKGTQSLDSRFLAMFALIVFAGTRPHTIPAPIPLATAFIALFLARTTLLATAWHLHNTDLANLRTAIAPLTQTDKTYLASVSPAEAPAYWSTAPLPRRLSNTIRTDTHLPALILIERHAFWPLLFDDPTQQPILLTPPYQSLADQNGGLVDHLALRPATLCGYTHLLLLTAAADPGFSRPYLAPITTTETAALFRIRPHLIPCTAP